MTIAASGTPNRRKRPRWRSPIAGDTVSTVFACAALLIIPLFTADAAGWQIDLDVLLPVSAFAVLHGLVMARSHFGDLSALLISLLYGIFATVFAATLQSSLPFRDALLSTLERGFDWARDAISGGLNTDPLALTFFIGILFWYFAFNACWNIFRANRVWNALAPPGLFLLVTLIFHSGEEALDAALFAFLLVSLGLLVRSNLEDRRWNWAQRGIRIPTLVRRQFAIIGILLALLALAFAWSIPSNDLQERLDTFQRFLASDPIEQLSELWNRLFAPIEGEGPSTTDYYGADLLQLSGAISLGDDIVLEVEAPADSYRYYWRARVFERYAGGQWSPSADLRFTDRVAPLEIALGRDVIGGRRAEVRQTFFVGAANSRIFYGAPQAKAIDQGGRLDLIYTDAPSNASMNVSIARPLRVLRQGESYRVTSLLSVASAGELRGAGRDYPDWVSGVNLFVGSRSLRVENLARSIVREAAAINPYDQAKAIESWLRENIRYNEAVGSPPGNVDAVEWLLFDAREGYCTYYATAMIVMLRHLGIPARLAAGFSQGNFDAGSGRFIVREREAHTWVEVYFPGYGWVEFEPTSAEAPLQRPGDDEAQEDQEEQAPQTAIPTASLTPTSTPTPSPSPSPTVAPSQEAQQQNLPPPTATPTLTPSPPPPPSPTPVILPTVVPPIAPDEPPPLSLTQPFLVLALAMALFLVILALIALLLFWWWEWRGLGELSPISRAYARLERYIGLLGIHIGRTQTTLEKRRELQRRLPAASEPIRTISDLYTRERYGSGVDADDDSGSAESAERAWTRTRGNILRRWLRRWLPFLRRDR